MPVRHEFATDAAFEEALRNWFAGQALAGLMSNGALAGTVAREADSRGIEPDELLATAAYNAADAMLAARTRSQSQAEEAGR
jgi:hypothetical protein